jgi:hypothetical protein
MPHTLYAELFYRGGVDQYEVGVVQAQGACENAKKYCTARCGKPLARTCDRGKRKVTRTGQQWQ